MLMMQGQDVVVCVIAGSWECSEKAVWEFVVAKDCYARAICMNRNMSYEELMNQLTVEFGLDAANWKPKISYWLPGQLSVFSVNTRPPVTVETNMGVRNFLRVRETELS